MRIKYIIMRTISKSFEIFLFLLLVFVPCSVFADDFEDDFIDNAEIYEQANEVNNQSYEDIWRLTPEHDLDKSEDLSSEPTKEEDLSGEPDPEGFRNSKQDPEPEKNESSDNVSEDSDNNMPGSSEGSGENQKASSEPSDYSEDLDIIINLLQNVQLTLMIVCGIIIGFFFITRILP